LDIGGVGKMRLFHGTTAAAWERIKVQGLRGNGWGLVYLTPLVEEAECHGGIVLEVETGELRLSALEDCKEWEVFCWGDIPPEQIWLHRRLGPVLIPWVQEALRK